MKVSELIAELEQFQKENVEDELDVEFAYDYGDHCHNVVTESIRTVERAEVIYSDYHLRNKVVDDVYDEEQDRTQVILLQ